MARIDREILVQGRKASANATCSLHGERQTDRELRPDFVRTTERNCAAVGHNDFTAETQTKPTPTRRAVAIAVETEEALEEFAVFARRNPGSRIRNHELGHARFQSKGETDFAG